MKKRRRERKRKRIRMTVLSVAVAVVILLLTAAVKRNDGGQQVETHEEVKNDEAMSSCTQNANTLTGAAVPEQEKEFEEVYIEGMVPVYGREGIDYISLDDFELMGKTVFAEAKTEAFEGQVAVAEVILNRVESENFPDTVEEVIKQDGAFSTWGNGSVEAAPLDDECLEAVQDAVNERIFPDSVVYFREGHFHSFGTPYTVIGHHYFSSEEGEDR